MEHGDRIREEEIDTEEGNRYRINGAMDKNTMAEDLPATFPSP
jgi:hypothetical protein